MTDRTMPQGIQRFASESVPVWMEWSGTLFADVLNDNDSPQLMLGAVGFLRAPPGAHSTFRADEALELVYVASPPYGSANRDARAALLDAAAKHRDDANV